MDRSDTARVVSFYARKLTPRKTLDSFVTDEVKALGSFACGFEKRRAATLGGERATTLEYSSCLGNYLLEYAVVHRGRGHDIYLLVPPGHEARDRSTFRSIMKTFRFTR